MYTPLPKVEGPIANTEENYFFSTMKHTRAPFNLEEYGYVEEEYFLSGTARVFENQDGQATQVGESSYTNRVIVRRPAGEHSGRAWVSILNASQGYDVEDDWRRAWNYIIENGDVYVAVTSKPIQVSALQNFNAERYASMYWGGPMPKLDAEPGWDPMQILEGPEEGLAWDILAQSGRWVRSGENFPATPHVYMIGQSQSGMYTNTYLHYFHDVLRGEDGAQIFDGYLPGVAATFSRSLRQGEKLDTTYRIGGSAMLPLFAEPHDLDVPVIRVSCEGDTYLFPPDTKPFMAGDGEMSRHWHIAGGPHSDARSRVIPDNSEVVKAHRLPRIMDQDYLDQLSCIPLEPFITASMTAVDKWAREGVPAAPSVFFVVDEDANRFTATNGFNDGGVRMGLIENPIAKFVAADPGNPVVSKMAMSAEDVELARFDSLEDFKAACDEVDDKLEAAGYLEPIGRRLLHAVEEEIWERVTTGAHALVASPQSVKR
ncbi:alpha/beta hydrolase domain-containing protein [Actinotignum urinale]|uniref:alpha/beta hydrolase domain-containing protein n=1 Tax=Actinotignum urinale TaxID=190146 RepID=UPI00370D9114